ncbi:MAG: hypothetical protein HY390_03965 [Deltaproteobacteria bacterium]|nr:hypothetical protein [Deltaproteobacteria bacterium]
MKKFLILGFFVLVGFSQVSFAEKRHNFQCNFGYLAGIGHYFKGETHEGETKNRLTENGSATLMHEDKNYVFQGSLSNDETGLVSLTIASKKLGDDKKALQESTMMGVIQPGENGVVLFVKSKKVAPVSGNYLFAYIDCGQNIVEEATRKAQ